jgi:hypothetical protein
MALTYRALLTAGPSRHHGAEALPNVAPAERRIWPCPRNELVGVQLFFDELVTGHSLTIKYVANRHSSRVQMASASGP